MGCLGGGSLGGVQGGVQGGGIRRDFFFEFFAFQNRAQGSGRVGRGDDFPPPPGGTPPWYAQEGSDKVKISEIFGRTKKQFF